MEQERWPCSNQRLLIGGISRGRILVVKEQLGSEWIFYVLLIFAFQSRESGSVLILQFSIDDGRLKMLTCTNGCLFSKIQRFHTLEKSIPSSPHTISMFKLTRVRNRYISCGSSLVDIVHSDLLTLPGFIS